MPSSCPSRDVYCGVDSSCSSIVVAAIANNTVRLSSASQEELEDALAALEVCLDCECDCHARERDARQLLDSTLNALLGDDEDEQEGPHCECRGTCNACTPGAGRWV